MAVDTLHSHLKKCQNGLVHFIPKAVAQVLPQDQNDNWISASYIGGNRDQLTNITQSW